MRMHFLLNLSKKRTVRIPAVLFFGAFLYTKKAASLFHGDTAFYFLIFHLIIRTFNTPSTASRAFTISSVASLSRSIMV